MKKPLSEKIEKTFRGKKGFGGILFEEDVVEAVEELKKIRLKKSDINNRININDEFKDIEKIFGEFNHSPQTKPDRVKSDNSRMSKHAIHDESVRRDKTEDVEPEVGGLAGVNHSDSAQEKSSGSSSNSGEDCDCKKFKPKEESA